MTTPPTVAITGATGLLGSHLCDAFAARGWHVRALARNPAAAPASAEARFRCDLPDAIDPMSLRGADVVVHCAYTTRFTTLRDARRVNEEGTIRLLAAARDAAVTRFLFVSSTSAHPAAVSYYGRSKYGLEQRLDPAHDLAVRPGLILAREGGLFERIRESVRRSAVVPIFGGGRQVLQTVHVDDLCEGIARAIDREATGTITIAEPEGVLMREFVRMIAEGLGRRPVLLPVPFGPALVLMRLAEGAHLRLSVSSENLLGLKALRHVPATADLARLDLRVRTARESLTDLFRNGVAS